MVFPDYGTDFRVVMTIKGHHRNQVQGTRQVLATFLYLPQTLPQTSLMLPATGHGSIASPESLWLVLVFQAFKIILEVMLCLFGLCQSKLLALESEISGMFAGTVGRLSLRNVSPSIYTHC